MTIVIGLFDGLPQAQRAITAAVVTGYPLDRVSILLRACDAREPAASTANRDAMPGGTAGVTVAGPLAAGAQPTLGESGLRSVIRTLMAAGLRDASSCYFAKAVADGAVLVAVHCDHADAHVAREILDAHSNPAASATPRRRSPYRSASASRSPPSPPRPKPKPRAPVKEPQPPAPPVQEPPEAEENEVEAQP